MDLTKLFDPRAVAVVGASADPKKVGYALVKNLTGGPQSRAVYPVTLGTGSVLGRSAVKNMKDIKGPVDLALVAVPAKIVPAVLKDCGKKKVPFVVVISAGFREMGEEGRALERRLTAIAKRYGVALIGPNCLGVLDGNSGLNATFGAADGRPGSLAFVSQSGALGAALLDWASAHGVGFSKFVSLGNAAGVTELDVLEHLSRDAETTAILLYLERVNDGARFMRLTSRITRTKPVVIIKAGRSARGSAAVASHTGSLAPADATFTAACLQSGVIVVDTIRELFNIARLFREGIRKPLRRIAVLTNGGGPSVIAADLIDSSRALELADLSAAARRKLQAVLPPMAAVGNPVDIIGDAGAERYDRALEILVRERGVDAILALLTPQMMTEAERTAELFLKHGTRKPVIPVLMGGHAIRGGVTLLESRGSGNFWFPDDAIRGLELLAGTGTKRVVRQEPDEERAVEQLRQMDAAEAQKLLRRYRIVFEGRFVRGKSGLAGALRALGPGPYAMKVVSPDVVHKTDVGGVALDIADVPGAAAAWEHIVRSVKRKFQKAKIRGMVVQPMRAGREVIIGMKRDPVFGPAIMVGVGGIFVETLKDISLRIAPVGPKEAAEMLRELKAYPLLKGLRGEKSVNFELLEKLIVNLSRLALSNPKLSEIDLNPVIATPKQSWVVDVRILSS